VTALNQTLLTLNTVSGACRNALRHLQSTKMKQRTGNKELGVALLMVIVMIAITSALLISLTESTFISMRINRAAEQRIKAEYLLKSAFNVARVLIKNDSTQTDDPTKDAWMLFSSSKEIPPAYLETQETHATVQMVIISEKGKIPLRSLVSNNSVNQGWRDVLVYLFQSLGFDNDQRPEIGARCRFEQPSFCTSTEMVANLIDYLDRDDISYSSSPLQGIESDLPTGEKFRNQEVLDSPEELLLIPGFTPKRVQDLLPLVTIETKDRVNANAAKAPVLQAIASLDPSGPVSAGVNAGEELVKCRGLDMLGPFKQIQQDISACFQSQYPSLGSTMATKLEVSGNVYRVIARVEYGLADISFMGTAVYETQGTAKLPRLKNMLLY
jgi:type II secretory pathway component PulK